MKLSQLQKYILLQSFDCKKLLDRKVLLGFYNSYKKKPNQEIMVNSLTTSLERLIKKGLLVGFGEFTQYKNYIIKVRLTLLGRKVIKNLLGQQKKLPFKLKK